MPRERGILTVAYAVVYALLAVSYAVWPPPRISRPGIVSVARYIDQLVPVWSIGFGLLAVALVTTLLVWRRWQWVTHSVAAAIVAGYGVAALLSGFLSEVFYGSPLALVCFATTVTHLVFARRYAVVSEVQGRHTHDA